MGRVSLAVVVLFGTACSGDGGERAAPLTTVPPPDSSAVILPSTTVPTTLDQIPSTGVPTTTAGEVGDMEAVEQAAIDAYNAYHAAILDPSNPDLRAEIERTHGLGGLDFVLGVMDDLVELNQRARPHPELVPTAEIIGAVRFGGTDAALADLVFCEINPEAFVEIGAALNGSDSLVRDDVYTVKTIAELEKLDGSWRLTAGETIEVLVGDVGCR